MSVLKSLRKGMSKSYQSLNTLTNDNDYCQPNYDPVGPERTLECLTVDNYPHGKNKNKSFRAFKNAMSKVSHPAKFKVRTSRSSLALGEIQNIWKITEEENSNDIMGKLRNGNYSKIPSSMMVPAEQVSPLLGNFLSEGLDDIKLHNVQLTLAHSKTLQEDGSAGIKETVDTRHGPITIAIAGDRSKPIILTYHDLALNHVTNFQNFLFYPEMRQLLNSFCVVHVNAPGQEQGAPTLPEDYVYPTMEELAETINCVKNHVGFKSCIGFGVGLGANVLARYNIKYPDNIDALVLINCSSTQAGWIEWGYQKVNIRHLKAGRMTAGSVDYLLWHHFGKIEECNQDLVTVYKQHFDKALNPTNLGLIIDSYIRRTDLGIVRELDPNKKKDVKMLRCPVLNITSIFSPHVDDTVTLNSRLDPSSSTWMKVQDCGLVIDEHPGKICEAFKLFLQGQGYTVNLRRLGSRNGSLTAIMDHPDSQVNNSNSVTLNGDIRITENPLQNPTV